MSLPAEQAGGGNQRRLEVQPTGLHLRVPVILRSQGRARDRSARTAITMLNRSQPGPIRI